MKSKDWPSGSGTSGPKVLFQLKVRPQQMLCPTTIAIVALKQHEQIAQQAGTA